MQQKIYVWILIMMAMLIIGLASYVEDIEIAMPCKVTYTLPER